ARRAWRPILMGSPPLLVRVLCAVSISKPANVHRVHCFIGTWPRKPIIVPPIVSRKQRDVDGHVNLGGFTSVLSHFAFHSAPWSARIRRLDSQERQIADGAVLFRSTNSSADVWTGITGPGPADAAVRAWRPAGPSGGSPSVSRNAGRPGLLRRARQI